VELLLLLTMEAATDAHTGAAARPAWQVVLKRVATAVTLVLDNTLAMLRVTVVMHAEQEVHVPGGTCTAATALPRMLNTMEMLLLMVLPSAPRLTPPRTAARSWGALAFTGPTSQPLRLPEADSAPRLSHHTL
jgi:hypothetical protein